MKLIKILSLCALLAATLFQGWMGMQYHVWIATLEEQTEKTAAAQIQAEASNGELRRLHDAYNGLPRPTAEICGDALRDSGCTNVQCLVWGERDGKMIGFMIGESNHVDFLPHLEMKLLELSADDPMPKKRL